MLTTSFGHSIRRNQHCINLRSHLSSAASFVLNQLQKHNIRDFFFRYTIPNVETENFTFDRESGILQEADDEREFYQRVVLPKTKDLPFRSNTDQQQEVDYEVTNYIE